MANYLHQSHFGAFTISQIWQGLNSRNISRKVVEIHAREQNEIKRQNFLRLTSIYTAEQRFYIDERLHSSLIKFCYILTFSQHLIYNSFYFSTVISLKKRLDVAMVDLGRMSEPLLMSIIVTVIEVCADFIIFS
jgi:hypothetical protein